MYIAVTHLQPRNYWFVSAVWITFKISRSFCLGLIAQRKNFVYRVGGDGHSDSTNTDKMVLLGVDFATLLVVRGDRGWSNTHSMGSTFSLSNVGASGINSYYEVI